MSSHEWRWRAQDALHGIAERAQVRAGRARWRRDDLRGLLERSALEACREGIDQADWSAVHGTLAARIAGRQARFVLDPSSTAALRHEILERWPDAARDAATRADGIIDGTCDLLGYRNLTYAPGGRIDWHLDAVNGRSAPLVFYGDVPFLNPEIGDHKVIWELNRHQHWMQLGRAAWLTGEARYPKAIVDQFESWLAANPPLVGVNWASMLEIAFRAISWTWALHALLGVGRRESDVGRSSPWLVDMLIAIDRQLTHVERHLSYYFSPNTHLTGEALALYVVGTALPELSAAARWAQTGRRVLLDEIERQILPDGGHAERSTHYQRYTLDFYLLATQTARLAGETDAAPRFEDAAHRLAIVTRAMADIDGRLPLIGDDDGGTLWPIAGRACNDVRDSLAVAAVVLNEPDLAAWGIPEEAFWIAAPSAAAERLTAFAEAPAVKKADTTSTLLGETGYFVARGTDGSHAVLDVGPHGYRNCGHAHADALSLTLSIDGRPLLIDPGTSTYTMDPALRDRLRTTASHNTVTIDGRSQSVPAGPFHWQSTADARVISRRNTPAFDVIEAAHDGYAPLRHRRTLVRTSHAGWLVVDFITGGTGRHTAAAQWHFDPAWQVEHVGGAVRAATDSGDIAWVLTAGGDTTLLRGSAEGGWCAPVYGQLVPTATMHVSAQAETPFTLVTWIGSGRVFSSPVLHCTRLNDLTDPAVIVEIVDGGRSAVFLVRTTESTRRGAFGVGELTTTESVLHYVADRGNDLPLSSKATTDNLLSHGSEWAPIAQGMSTADPAANSGAPFAPRKTANGRCGILPITESPWR